MFYRSQFVYLLKFSLLGEKTDIFLNNLKQYVFFQFGSSKSVLKLGILPYVDILRILYYCFTFVLQLLIWFVKHYQRTVLLCRKKFCGIITQLLISHTNTHTIHRAVFSHKNANTHFTQ